MVGEMGKKMLKNIVCSKIHFRLSLRAKNKDLGYIPDLKFGQQWIKLNELKPPYFFNSLMLHVLEWPQMTNRNCGANDWGSSKIRRCNGIRSLCPVFWSVNMLQCTTGSANFPDFKPTKIFPNTKFSPSSQKEIRKHTEPNWTTFFFPAQMIRKKRTKHHKWEFAVPSA